MNNKFRYGIYEFEDPIIFYSNSAMRKNYHQQGMLKLNFLSATLYFRRTGFV
ncbi:hypothetical protein GCM10007103_15190 [Salinimicrobium marinum]|uniref:Uncharacterized protein n=1 Tax=Salinimicrobium marinum TaxID=680283 RepID=A0A918SBT5_9FLAO|nr:hypothetical protein GCM10007103_15190 [Salinimicrobium marinum]